MEGIETVGEELLAAPAKPAFLDVGVEEGYRLYENGIGERDLTSQRLVQRIRPRVMVPEDGREPFDRRRVVADAGGERRDALALQLFGHRLELVAAPRRLHALALQEGLVVVEEHGLELVRDRIQLVLVAPEVERPAEQFVVPLVLIRGLVEFPEQIRVDVLLRVCRTRRHDDVRTLATLQRRAYEPVHLSWRLESYLEVSALVRLLEGLLYVLLEVVLRPRPFEVAPVGDLPAATSASPTPHQERAGQPGSEGRLAPHCEKLPARYLCVHS